MFLREAHPATCTATLFKEDGSVSPVRYFAPENASGFIDCTPSGILNEPFFACG